MNATEINTLAEHTAISTIDAHGLENLPSAEIVMDFLENLAYENAEPVPALTRSEFRQFKHDYARHLRNHAVSLHDAMRAVWGGL